MVFVILSAGQGVSAYQIENLANTPKTGDYVIGPGKTELTVNPGDKKLKYLTVTNRYGKDMKFKVEIEDFTGSKNLNENIVLLGAEKGPYSLKDFLRPEVSEFTLKHGDRITLPVQINIPNDAQPGGLYGSVIIATVPDFGNGQEDSNSAQGSLNIISRLASLYFVRVNGAVNENGTLREFSTDKSVYGSSPINFKTLFENDGSIYVNPYGKITVNNMMGTTINEINIAPYFVMPGSVRLKEFKLQRGFMLGRYKATLTLNRGYANVIDEKTIYFWVLPWKIVGGGVVGLIFIIWLIKMIVSLFNNNFERKKKK